MKQVIKPLKDLIWMQYFRTSTHTHILSKTALVKGNKIGAYNPFGQLIWIDRNRKVIIVPEE